MNCKSLIPKDRTGRWKSKVYSIGHMTRKEQENWFKILREHSKIVKMFLGPAY